MAKKRRFIQCDVFSPMPAKGNALAVVVDGQGLSDVEMQEFAAWTNLAETTFLLPPEDNNADYKVKIFTTTREMLFAGHPTLGSCASWLHTGGVPKQPGLVRQECGIGIVEIDLTRTVPAFIAPPTDIQPLPKDAESAICTALKIDPQSVLRSARLDNGPVWQALVLNSAEDVLAVDSSAVRWPQYKSIGLIGPWHDDHECDYEVRMLAPSSGMSEDPITGSLNSALSHWLYSTGDLQRDLIIAQGTTINRYGRVYMQPDSASPGRVYIGGETNILIEGTVTM